MKFGLVLILISTIFLSGCSLIGSIEEFGCGFLDGKNEDHCYQDAAVRKSDFDTCDKIEAAEFTDAQGPAPKDKCYLRIAEKTGDPSGCDKIQGGMISYSKQECIYRAAITAGDPEICNSIEGSYSNMMATFNKETCLAQLKERGIEEDNDEDESDDDEGDEEEGEDGGECKYDTDCSAICEGNTKWKRGCNARTNLCENTFNTDCSADVESFGSMEFPKVCQGGECVRDSASITAKRNELTTRKQAISDEVKSVNAQRDRMRDAMLDANKNCINGIADMTNVAIMEFSTRIASIAAGGVPGFADAMVDYAGDALNKLYAYSDGTPPENKLTPAEYIKLNCDLYNYFKNTMAESDTELDTLLEEANEIQDELDSLP